MKNKSNPLPDLKLLNEMFTYCSETGNLIWKERPLSHFKLERTMNIFNNMYAGKPVGATYKNGYKYFDIKEDRYLVHRVIWKLHSGNDPEGIIDHIDRDNTNNRIENLRDVSFAVNGQNRASLRNTSGEIGVNKTRGGKWSASITIRNNTISLGVFDTIEEARLARLDAEANRNRYDNLEEREIINDNEVNLKFLKECFIYEHETGFLYWKNRPESHFRNTKSAKMWNTMWSGKKAGYLISGYYSVKLAYKPYRMNRLVWWLHSGEKPTEAEIIDHINGDALDNRIENLRISSHLENSRNRGKSANNTSGFKGVTWSKKVDKWQATIRFDNKSKWLGYHDTPELAHAAYCKASTELHGEFSNHG
jgi:hypothetical protein